MNSIINISFIMLISTLLGCGGGGGGGGGSDNNNENLTSNKSFSVDDSWGTGQCLNIDIHENTLYCAASTTLDIYNIENSTPKHLKSVDTSQGLSNRHITNTVTVAGNLLFISGSPLTRSYQGWLSIFNIDDPENPSLVGNLEIQSSNGPRMRVHNIYHYNETLFLIYEDEGLGIVDISNPEEPQLISHTAFSQNRVSGVLSVGDVMYLSGDHGLSILDFTDLENPNIIFENTDWASSYRYYSTPLVKHENSLYHITNEGILLLDISNIYNPQLVTTIDDTHGRSVQVENEKVLFTRYNSIEVYEQSPDQTFSRVESLPINDAKSLKISGKNIIISSDNGLTTIDLDTYTINGKVDSSGLASSFALANGNIHLQHSSDTIKVLDKQFNLIGTVFDQDARFSLHEDTAYDIGPESFTVLQFSSSFPSSMTQLARILYRDLPITTLTFWDFKLLDGILYYLGYYRSYDLEAAESKYSFILGNIDIRTPQQPRLLGHVNIILDEHDFIDEFTVNGDLIYLPTNRGESYVVDISNPEDIALAGNFSLDEFSAYSMSFDESTMYIFSHDYRIATWDVTNPTAPTFLASYQADIPTNLTRYTSRTDIQVVEGTLYFINYDSRICAEEIDSINNFDPTCSEPLVGYATKLQVISSDEIYASAGDSGKIFKLSYK